MPGKDFKISTSCCVAAPADCRPVWPMSSTELVEFHLGPLQLTVNNVQANYERAHMDASSLSHAVRHFYGRFTQFAENRLGIDAADAVSFEQVLGSGFAYVCRLGWRRCLLPKFEQPCHCKI